MTQAQLKYPSLPMRVFFMFMFAFMFSGLGYFIPRIYFEYFDKTQYYQVQLPIQVENKEYHPCDFVNVTLKRKALADIDAEATIELRLIKEDSRGDRDILDKQIRKMSIQRSPLDEFTKITAHWPLPCALPDGVYLFEGLTKYQVNGVNKTTTIRTEEFIVTNLPPEEV